MPEKAVAVGHWPFFGITIAQHKDKTAGPGERIAQEGNSPA
jgi:hypothetical protein